MRKKGTCLFIAVSCLVVFCCATGIKWHRGDLVGHGEPGESVIRFESALVYESEEITVLNHKTRQIDMGIAGSCLVINVDGEEAVRIGLALFKDDMRKRLENLCLFGSRKRE